MELNVPTFEGAPEGFPFLEKSASKRLGLNKDEARALRKEVLHYGDFVLFKKRVLLSAAGLQKLSEAATGLKLKKARPGSNGEQPPAVKKAAPMPAEVVELVVVKCDLANPHMLAATPVKAWDVHENYRLNQTVRVRVRRTEGFRRGMQIKAQLVEGYQDLYDLAQALPKLKQQEQP